MDIGLHEESKREEKKSACVVKYARIAVVDGAIGRGAPKHLWNRFGHPAKVHFARPQLLL